MRMTDDKMKGNYNVSSIEMEQKKHYLPWSPLERNRFARKHTYVSCSKSVPRRNKHFVRYNMSRSLNSDKNVCGSSPENSSFEEDKRMSRSSKIMKALNFHTNLSHYGKTKIKKSLNFNLTPSPKRFSCAKKCTQQASRSSSLSAPNKLSDLVKDPDDCANNSFAPSSSDSIDENQNETPLRRRAIERETLHYSTPNAKSNTKSLFSVNSTPLLRGRLKETIADIVHVNGTTPVSQPSKCVQGNSKRFDSSMTNTSRNLFHEFHEDDDDDRPQTPENVITIIPDSMSAIKRSHKKEKSSRRSGYCVMQLTNSSPDSSKPHMERLSLDHSENDISDTGSLFDYTEESKFGEESSRVTNCDIIVPLTNFHERDVKETTSHESAKNISETVVPEVTADAVLESDTSVTSQNSIHFLRKDADHFIKRSYKKSKETNQTKLYGIKIPQHKVEAVKGENETYRETITKPNVDIVEDKLVFTEESCSEISERACTPEKVNSSRLLLSQFSSVKKSHKKDKHANILSGFQKRQEYFNEEMDSARYSKTPESDVDVNDDVDVGVGVDVDVDVDVDVGVQEVANLTDSSCSLDVSSDKLSPSKRKIPLDEFLEHDTSVSCDSELQDCDIFQKEFQIFTPLKRKRSLIASNSKGYSHFYDLPSGKDKYSEADLANVNLSRCLTPILNIREHCEPSTERQSIATNSNESERLEAQDHDPNDRTGRSTPKNMSTAELYLNLDSIKKSHRKNKRGSNSRKLSFNPIENSAVEKGNWQNLSTEIGNDSFENFELSQSDCDGNGMRNDSTSNEDDNVQGSSCIGASEQAASNTNVAEIALQNVTPPNCLKTKNYIKLLQETSIKRSHKKIRDQRKHEESIEPNQLSDDGSLFGDEEKLLDTEST